MIELWKILLEISILWFVIYQIILFFTGTRALQVIRGIIMLLILFFLIQRLDLERLEWLLTKLFALSVLGLLIVFQPEIRQGLARLGRHHLFTLPLPEEELDNILKEIIKAVDYLARQSIGALIAIEKDVTLKPYVETGVSIDATITSELLQNIFTPGSLLHDGGVIIQQGRIASAGCLFPLNENPDLSRIFGMRHRAAIGLTQETDSVVIVVSEERQDISLVYEGKLFQGIKRDDLLTKVKQLMKPKTRKNEI
ncbi:MAG: diadenylate cyclase CdaA [Candidatus Omnitrophica bacterium]|nr:diadenylate cyclase CdaA [Candidatus Omnitrophota bacterium]MBU1871906.1 diadenylate cyclase CdaA [Candidatus Omnitrophota bacterium]